MDIYCEDSDEDDNNYGQIKEMFHIMTHSLFVLFVDMKKTAKSEYLLTGEEVSIDSKYVVALNRAGISSQPIIELPTLHEKTRGFLQYVPDTMEKFKLYWKLAAGRAVVNDGNQAMSVASVRGGIGGMNRIVPAKCVIR